MTQTRFSSCPAFTLVETLVSVAIVAILAILVIAGTNRFIRQGSGVVCASNMRQTATAILQYANDNGGYFPPIQDTDGIKSWVNTIVAYMDANPSNELQKWNATRRVMRCPELRRVTGKLTGKTSEDQYTIHQMRNFAMNAFLGPGTAMPTNWRTLASVIRPSDTMLLTESGLGVTGDCVGVMDNYWIGQSTLDENLKLRPGVHDGANNIAWCDGHISKWKNVSLLQKAPYRDGSTEDKWTGRK